MKSTRPLHLAPAPSGAEAPVQRADGFTVEGTVNIRPGTPTTVHVTNYIAAAADELVPVKEAAKRFGLELAALERAVEELTIPATMLGRKVCIRISDVCRLVDLRPYVPKPQTQAKPIVDAAPPDSYEAMAAARRAK